MKMRWLGTLALIGLLLTTVTVATAAATRIQGRFHSVGGSRVTGRVTLVQQPGGGTRIKVVAFGLKPGETYLSLYYDNHVCELKPDSANDVIGTRYKANTAGVGATQGKIDDDLDKVDSVSVRRASDFALLACVDVHPGKLETTTSKAPLTATGTVGTCATSTVRSVVNTANITFGPNPLWTTGFVLTPGSSFTVCTDSNIPGWTTFKITPQTPILFVPAGTFG